MRYLLQISFTALLFVGVSQTALAQINTAEGGAGNVLPNADTKNTNVGIGTDKPASKLSVVGGVSVGEKYSDVEAPEFGAIIEGNVGIGTYNPTAKLEVIGDLKANRGFFTNSLPNGTVFTNGADRNDKSLVFSAGRLLGTGPGYLNTRLLTFFDFPQSNFNAKSMVWFGIEDRGDFNRYRFHAEEGGSTTMMMQNKSQQEIMKIHEDGTDNIYMHFPKPNSRVIIGGVENNPNAAGHKLFVQSGSARVEGNIVTDAKVGIGVADPKFKLDIEGGGANGVTFASNADRDSKVLILNAGTVVDASTGRRMLTFSDYPQSNLNPQSWSWFGIEDRADNNRLHFTATQGGYSDLTLNNGAQEPYFRASNNANFSYLEMPKADSHFVIGGTQAYPIEHQLWVKSGTTRLEGDLFAATHVGIGGATTFIDALDSNKEYKLSVKGRIRAEEIKVYNTWADYVFAPEYNLPTLKEVESYIKQNGHLQNVPSAKEITEKGLELGEMAKIQQEKIEELTLYLIQQNKEIEELKTLVKALMEKK